MVVIRLLRWGDYEGVFCVSIKAFSLLSYLAMVVVVVVYQLATPGYYGGRVVGGWWNIIYSLGVIFYASQRIQYNHSICICLY